MENPYRYLRILAGITQLDFAKKYELSRTTMTHIETGQFADLSDYQIESLGRELYEKEIDAEGELLVAYGKRTLSEAYQQWKTTERIQNAHLFHRVLPTSGTLVPPTSPMEQFIVDTTRTHQKFCKTLKVPAATVLRYARGTTRSMPVTIRTALEEVGYPYMAELVGKQDIWVSKAVK